MITITLANNGEAQALDYALNKGSEGLRAALEPGFIDTEISPKMKKLLAQHLQNLDNIRTQLKGLQE